ncbi:MAG: Gfo/Idh/MocA family oxidoreductase [Clostridia bacterium]|nr:Gfo/Idh/MocA family oxidoreductase [Clostridia bacterium]
MINVGMVGVGAISGIYLKNITQTFKEIRLVAVCDLIRERAEKAVTDYGVPKIYDTMHELFADPEIDLVLNLTRPYEHYDVTKAALLAGKHVYSEKPLAASLEEGKELVAIAEEKGLMLGGAPDTFMGAGIQTCREIIDRGLIGTPIGCAAFMICHGHESWHPDPAFYYKYGGGPMMDMGPYYLTAMVNLLGGIRSVSAVCKKSFDQRIITSQPFSGTVVDVDVPTYVTGILNFDSGATGTLFTTFDVYYKGQARFEIYGTEGTLYVPDPNGFGGPVKLLRPEDGEIREMPLLFDYKENSRALGLADIAKAIETGRFCRTDYHQTFHVLEAMDAFQKASDKGKTHRLKSKYTRKPAMKHNPIHGILD